MRRSLDENRRRTSRFLTRGATAFACLLVLVVTDLAASQTVKMDRAVPIRGGVFEASGVTAVPGTDGVLFVDDNTSDAVYWMRIDGSGAQVGTVERVPLGVAVADPEGITNDGTSFYVVGSQSKVKGQQGAGLVRFKFDAESKRVRDLERVDDLASVLLGKLPELARLAKGEGLNIEAIAWDARHGRLLLGLRGPLDGSRAIVVPLAVSSGGSFAAASLKVGDGGLIRMDLGGKGIRSLEAGDGGEMLVIAGATDSEKRVDFTLWEWNGTAGSAPRLAATLDRDLKPEGVARVTISGVARTIVVCDVGRLLALNAD